MRIASCLILSLAVIVNSIDLNSQTSYPGLNFPRPEISQSPDRHYAPGSSNRYSPSAQSPLRARSKSPSASQYPLYVLGYPLEKLRFIRLIPFTNPSRQFQIERYTFPRDKPIYVRGDHQVLLPMPTTEQTVLLTSDGEIFAIVEDNRRLRGIYTMRETNQVRVKINMYTGAVNSMIREEMREALLGKNSPISKCFGMLLVNTDLSSHTSNIGPDASRSVISNASDRNQAMASSNRSSPSAESSLGARSRSPAASHSVSYILGYTPEELKFIRLIPHTNPSRRFEIRRYSFPRDKPIQVKGEKQVLLPMPIEEQTVLSTSDGEVFAIADDNRKLRGIYTTKFAIHRRAKINMYSGEVKEMTTEEIQETPLGRNVQISKCFGTLNLRTEISAPISNPGPGVPLAGISYSPDRLHAPGSSERSSPPAESTVHTRSISPPDRHSSLQVLGFTLEELRFIRLIPHANPLRRFELRRYTFPRDKPIHLKGYQKERLPIPTEEQTVVSTSDGEVFAILEDNKRLRGIFTIRVTTQRRAKINMYSGAVDIMTIEETQETPLPKNSSVLRSFEIVRVKDSPPRLINFPILNRFES